VSPCCSLRFAAAWARKLVRGVHCFCEIHINQIRIAFGSSPFVASYIVGKYRGGHLQCCHQQVRRCRRHQPAIHPLLAEQCQAIQPDVVTCTAGTGQAAPPGVTSRTRDATPYHCADVATYSAAISWGLTSLTGRAKPCRCAGYRHLQRCPGANSTGRRYVLYARCAAMPVRRMQSPPALLSTSRTRVAIPCLCDGCSHLQCGHQFSQRRQQR